VVFVGGSYLVWFPLRGVVSANWSERSWPARILDYAWHMVLPVTALVIGGFASLTMLTKNSFLDPEVRRLIEAQGWMAWPPLYLLIILASLVEPTFWWLTYVPRLTLNGSLSSRAPR
jgi:hypothetical protein